MMMLMIKWQLHDTPDNGVNLYIFEARIDLVIDGVWTCVIHLFVYREKEREREAELSRVRIKSILIWIFCMLSSDLNLK